MTKRLLSAEQAFNAMFVFLDQYYERTGRTPELGTLLGELQLNREGRPFDPAAWDDWLAAVSEATKTRRKAVNDERP